MIDGVLNIATTNYPERLDKRLVSRPRRFDRVLKVDVPSDAVRKEFLKFKLPKGSDIKEWVKKTKDMSLAAVTEAIISVTCLGNDLDDTIAILKSLEKDSPSSEDFGSKATLGFKEEAEEEVFEDDY